MKIRLRRLLRQLGFDIIHRRPVLVDLLAHYGIETVLDVGANIGQFAATLREWGYTGRIISFEPASGPFRQLRQKADRDSRWDAINTALGDYDGVATIFVSARSEFNSLLPGLPRLYAYDSCAAPIGQEEVTINRLDSVLGHLPAPLGNLFLKVDTQGYEQAVLRGAARILPNLRGMQLEVSLVPLYEREATLAEMLNWLERDGFTLIHVEPVNYDPKDLSLLQLDCVFLQRSLLAGKEKR